MKLSHVLGLVLVGSSVLQANDATLMTTKSTASGNKIQGQQQGQPAATSLQDKLKRATQKPGGSMTILPAGIKN